MKRLTAFLLILAMCLGLFTACGEDEIPDGPAELWVVTELTDKYGMNDQAERMIERFNELYPEVTVKLDILPTEKEERAVYLQKLRTQIMGGAGPDAYLLPTHNIVPDTTSMYGEGKRVDPLFRNMSQTMYNGLFYDISEFYDEDETLEKEKLNTSVMDGVMVDDARFILPLRYDSGVYLVNSENLETLGLDAAMFEADADDVMRSILETGNSGLAKGFSYFFEEIYFSDFVDNEKGQPTLTADEVAEFMRLYQRIMELAGKENGNCYSSAELYIWHNSFFASEGYGYDTILLSSAASAAAMGKFLGEDLEMYPQLASDGTLHAVVRYYAAVGAGAEYPKLAYEFIKLFLSEEAQFETYLKKSRATQNACPGWPVRTVGSVEPRLELHNELLDNDKSSYRMWPTSKKRAERFLAADITLTDSDVPAVSWQVDKVIFPIIMEYEDSLSSYMSSLCDYDHNNAPTDVDIDALAQQYIANLQLYLDEG